MSSVFSEVDRQRRMLKTPVPQNMSKDYLRCYSMMSDYYESGGGEGLDLRGPFIQIPTVPELLVPEVVEELVPISVDIDVIDVIDVPVTVEAFMLESRGVDLDSLFFEINNMMSYNYFRRFSSRLGSVKNRGLNTLLLYCNDSFAHVVDDSESAWECLLSTLMSSDNIQEFVFQQEWSRKINLSALSRQPLVDGFLLLLGLLATTNHFDVKVFLDLIEYGVNVIPSKIAYISVFDLEPFNPPLQTVIMDVVHGSLVLTVFDRSNGVYASNRMVLDLTTFPYLFSSDLASFNGDISLTGLTLAWMVGLGHFDRNPLDEDHCISLLVSQLGLPSEWTSVDLVEALSSISAETVLEKEQVDSGLFVEYESIQLDNSLYSDFEKFTDFNYLELCVGNAVMEDYNCLCRSGIIVTSIIDVISLGDLTFLHTLYIRFADNTRQRFDLISSSDKSYVSLELLTWGVLSSIASGLSVVDLGDPPDSSDSSTEEVDYEVFVYGDDVVHGFYQDVDPDSNQLSDFDSQEYHDDDDDDLPGLRSVESSLG